MPLIAKTALPLLKLQNWLVILHSAKMLLLTELFDDKWLH